MSNEGIQLIPTKKSNIVLDASQIDMFSLCEERFRLRYILNKSLPTKAKQLDRGTLLHAGYELYYKGIKAGRRYKELMPEVAEHMKKLSMTESDLSPAEVGRIIDVTTENLEYWEIEDLSFEILLVEEPFLYLLYEDDFIRIYLSGKIDLLVNWHTPKMTYTNLPIDHKSYERSFPVPELSNQFINYATATNSENLIVNRVGLQKTLTAQEKHVRPMLSFDANQKEQWKQNIIKIVNRYITCIAEDSWIMNFTSCDKFNRKCEFYDLCKASGIEAKTYKLNADYITIAPWDVTKLLQKDELKREE